MLDGERLGSRLFVHFLSCRQVRAVSTAFQLNPLTRDTGRASIQPSHIHVTFNQTGRRQVDCVQQRHLLQTSPLPRHTSVQLP